MNNQQNLQCGQEYNFYFSLASGIYGHGAATAPKSCYQEVIPCKVIGFRFNGAEVKLVGRINQSTFVDWFILQ